jgi:hypothetical protein
LKDELDRTMNHARVAHPLTESARIKLAILAPEVDTTELEDVKRRRAVRSARGARRSRSCEPSTLMSDSQHCSRHVDERLPCSWCRELGWNPDGLALAPLDLDRVAPIERRKRQREKSESSWMSYLIERQQAEERAERDNAKPTKPWVLRKKVGSTSTTWLPTS